MANADEEIQISAERKAELEELKEPEQSFDEIIETLVSEHQLRRLFRHVNDLRKSQEQFVTLADLTDGASETSDVLVATDVRDFLDDRYGSTPEELVSGLESLGGEGSAGRLIERHDDTVYALDVDDRWVVLFDVDRANGLATVRDVLRKDRAEMEFGALA